MAIQNIKAPFFLYSDYLRDLCCQQYNQLLSFHVITRQFILSLLSVISQLFIIVFHILVANEQLQTNRYDDIAKCNERHGANFLGSNQSYFFIIATSVAIIKSLHPFLNANSIFIIQISFLFSDAVVCLFFC